MKKSIIAVFAVAVLTLGATVVGTVKTSANNANAQAHGSMNNTNIVGVWEVDADAPYRPHLFTFHSDGTMSTTNPTNVQETVSNAVNDVLSAATGGTNDSLGMGTWKMMKAQNGQQYIVGTFKQLNASAATHLPADTLAVSFKVKYDDKTKTFDGDASAMLGNAVQPSHLKGTKVPIDMDAVNKLKNL